MSTAPRKFGGRGRGLRGVQSDFPVVGEPAGMTAVVEVDNNWGDMRSSMPAISPGRPILGSGINLQSSKSEFAEPEQDDVALSACEISVLNKIIHTQLVDTKESDLEILRCDPNHPLFSVKSFHSLGLKESLFKGIAAMNFMKPSTIQEKALPCVLGDPPQNMIAQSQSGTGKTATFLLAMLSRVNPAVDYCQCLCMAPTFELATQIADVAKTMARYMDDVKIGLAVRGTFAEVNGSGYVSSHILIGTPGTVLNYSQGKGSKIDFNKICVFVLDEADVMIQEAGFLNITRKVRAKLTTECQILLFSATYNDEVVEFANEMVPNPVEIRIKQTQLTLKNIKQYYMQLSDHNAKYKAVTDIYGVYTVGQSIIFCATRKEAAWLKNTMYNDGHEVALLSGDLEVEDREDAIRKFRNGEFRCLITTNVSARGLDIPQVNLVVNWDMPRNVVTRSADVETYLHRIGRSGRFGKSGIAFNFISGENDMRLLQEIERYFSITIERVSSTDVSDLDKLSLT